jgi:hypothetical protein
MKMIPVNAILLVFQTGCANALAALEEQRSDREVKNLDLAQGLRSFATLHSAPLREASYRMTKVGCLLSHFISQII